MKNISIESSVSAPAQNLILSLVCVIWDVFDPDGIKQIVMGFEFEIDIENHIQCASHHPVTGHTRAGS